MERSLNKLFNLFGYDLKQNQFKTYEKGILVFHESIYLLHYHG